MFQPINNRIFLVEKTEGKVVYSNSIYAVRTSNGTIKIKPRVEFGDPHHTFFPKGAKYSRWENAIRGIQRACKAKNFQLKGIIPKLVEKRSRLIFGIIPVD